MASVLTCFSVFVWKCVEPIQAFSVPNGCSTVCWRIRTPLAHDRGAAPSPRRLPHVPSFDPALLAGRALVMERACLAVRAPAAMKRHAVLDRGVTIDQIFASGASIDIFLLQIAVRCLSRAGSASLRTLPCLLCGDRRRRRGRHRLLAAVSPNLTPCHLARDIQRGAIPDRENARRTLRCPGEDHNPARSDHPGLYQVRSASRLYR